MRQPQQLSHAAARALVAAGGQYRRRGTVRAELLQQQRRWYAPSGDGLYARTGSVRAVRLDEDLTLSTREGLVTGCAGDWLVFADDREGGESWVVSARHLAHSYAPA